MAETSQSPSPLAARLTRSGLRPTAKRLQLAHVLFSGGDRHFSADQALAMVREAGMKMSQATVYNTLNELAAAGLLNRITLDGKRTFFDTNTSDHHHLYYEDDHELLDVAGDGITVSGLPDLKPGEELRRVDVVIRVHRHRG